MSALKGVRIVELAELVAGEFCGKLLADFGAEVIKVERPSTGSPTRSIAPLVGTSDGPENSGLFAYLNTNKDSLVLDVATEGAKLAALIAGADVVIDDHDPEWLSRIGLSPEEMERTYPSVIFCSITPRGFSADKQWWNAKSFTVFNDCGWCYHTPSAPDPSKPPLKGPGRFVTEYDPGLEAAICIAANLYRRQQSGEGEFIDIAKRDVMISRADLILGRMLAGEDEPRAQRSAYDQPGPAALFPCADGSVYLYVTNQKHWRGLKQLMGNPDWIERFDENWLEFGVTEALVAEMRAGFREWVKDKHKEQVSEEAQQLGVPLVPVADASDLQRSPQHRHREFFKPLKHPVLGEKLYPTVPYRMSASPAELLTPAPALGQHRPALLEPRPRAATSSRQGRAPATRGGPLQGVRVLSLTKVWAGPHGAKLLAYLGAEVIKVESHTNLDELRAFGGVDIDHAPWFLSINPEVLSVQANMKTEEGRALVHDLVAHSDIVLNNLRPGAMERQGLSFAEMQAIKRDIISVSIKMWGNEGPLGHQTGYAPSFAALGGLSNLVGYEAGRPLGANMRYGDSTSGACAVYGAIAALLHRERTGEGQFVDVSAVESMASMAGDCFFHYSLTGEIPGPEGNRHSEMAPHGSYPCLDDEWIGIPVGSDAEWLRLCDIIGAPELAQKENYRTLAGRQADHIAIDARLAELTLGHDAATLAATLRAAGIAASKSLNTIDLIGDEDLWGREMFVTVSDDAAGARPVVGPGWHMHRNPASIARGAPKLGEHNDYVYGDILGLSPDRIAELIEQKIIY